MAVYRIEYYCDGEKVGISLWSGSLENAKEFARADLATQSADMARIIEVQGSGAEVDIVAFEK